MTDPDTSQIEASSPVESIDDLVAYFRSGETPRADWRIGTEHEKIGFNLETLARLPFHGECGIAVVLERVAQLDGWDRTFEGENLIALYKDGASITLEPGGQMELSGAPLKTIRETCAEFTAHVDLLKRATEDLGIAWLSLGADPLHDLASIPKVPKVRYDIMRSYLPTRASMPLNMMHETATVQANFDYGSEADMATKLRMATACSPVVSALYANSCISLGKENGFASRRVEIWRHTDPDRCGILDFVFDVDFSYRDYAQWAVDVPMFFVVRGDRYLPAEGATFRDFMERGFASEGEPPLRATLADWELHLTTLFPEVRLKRFIEVRGADAVPPDMICALPALWKGLFYDDDACSAALEQVAGLRREALEAAQIDVARRGLAASIGGRPVLEVADALLQIAAQGLRRIAEAEDMDPDERGFLDPLFELVGRGQSPAEITLEAWRGELQGSLRRLIERSRY